MHQATLQQSNYYNRHNKEMPRKNEWYNGYNNICYHGVTITARLYSKTTDTTNKRHYSRTVDAANRTKDDTIKQLIQQM